jgi:hypothetical protein
MDIEAAFPSMSNGRPVNIMKLRKINRNLK